MAEWKLDFSAEGGLKFPDLLQKGPVGSYHPRHQILAGSQEVADRNGQYTEHRHQTLHHNCRPCQAVSGHQCLVGSVQR